MNIQIDGKSLKENPTKSIILIKKILKVLESEAIKASSSEPIERGDF